MSSHNHLVPAMHISRVAVCGALTAALLLSGCSKSKDQAQQPVNKPMLTVPQDMGVKQRVAMGKAIFGKNCISCHGAEGSGGKAPSFKRTQFTYGRSADAIVQSIGGGRPKGMPAFGISLQAIELETLAAYVLSLK